MLASEKSILEAGKMANLFSKSIKAIARDMDFYCGAFPSEYSENYRNAVSALIKKNVIEFSERDISMSLIIDLMANDSDGEILTLIAELISSDSLNEKNEISKELSWKIESRTLVYFKNKVEKEVRGFYEEYYVKGCLN